MKELKLLTKTTELAGTGQPRRNYEVACLLEGARMDALALYQQRLAGTSVKTYKRAFNLFESEINTTIQDATPQHISDFISFMEKQKYANSTQNLYLSAISGLMEKHILCGTRQNNAVRLLNVIKKTSKPIDKQVEFNLEIDDLLKCKTTDKTGVIIRALYYTACRVSELINIKYSDITDCSKDGLEYKSIQIMGKGQKPRVVYMPADLYNDIRKLFNYKSDYLFHVCKTWKGGDTRGGQLNRVNLYRQIKTKFKKWTGKHVTPHTLRHLFANSKIVDEKQDLKAVSKYLGHSSVKITADIYTHGRLDAEFVLSRRV